MNLGETWKIIQNQSLSSIFICQTKNNENAIVYSFQMTPIGLEMNPKITGGLVLELFGAISVATLP